MSDNHRDEKLTVQEEQRYSRHIILNEIGIVGQEKLKAAKVLVIGAGGLGCPVLQYLTAAGVGTIGIVDDDVVEVSNLQRQVIYTLDDVGMPKVEIAKKRLKAQNIHINIISFHQKIQIHNIFEIFNNFDIIIDGSDNFPTRYLVSDACVILDKPLVFGAIYKFDGQYSVFNYQGGPSYRCLFPTPPKHGEVPSCSEIGVLGALPGIIGIYMATECIKIILGIGEVLSGKLALIDMLSNKAMQVSIVRNEENFQRKSLEKNYESFCGVSDTISEILPLELMNKLQKKENVQLIDVREPHEFKICHIDNSILIPLDKIAVEFHKIEKKIPTVVICHHGTRSKQAASQLLAIGYDNISSLKGGIHAWSCEVDIDMPTY